MSDVPPINDAVSTQEWVILGIPAVVWYLAVVVIIVFIIVLVFATVTMRGSKDAGRQP
ncbi:MAG: hypothetical protein KAQ96_00340 [Thermoplasmata archaeon]|nr:hypothetical protein [Thermoplasmata archaeon]